VDGEGADALWPRRHPRRGLQLRVTVPLRVTLLPLGPVTLPVWLQTPPEQLVLPLRVVVPRGPVCVCVDEQVPPAQEPDPVELQELPRGPVPPPERDQASALEVPAAISAVASMAGTRVVLNEAMCFSIGCNAISRRVQWRLASDLCSHVAGHDPECNDLYQAIVAGLLAAAFHLYASAMSTRARILVIEDDSEIRSLVQDYLQRQGFRVDVGDGATALDRFRATIGEPDLVVLDIMLPGEDGLSICRRLRASSRVPILMLTARGEDIDRIVGLEMGADDYLPKPFNPRELAARIRAILRRLEPPPVGQRRLILNDGFLVDLDARTIARPDGGIALTSAEFDLLECFLTRPRRVLSREQLMDWTRGRQADPLDRTIDVQVSRLRKKIECGTELIKTVRNAGYMLTAAVREA